MKENINYDDLKEKCIKVIWSCETEKQLESAIKYANLACAHDASTNVNVSQLKRTKFLIALERCIAITQYRQTVRLLNRTLYHKYHHSI